jgi:predicted tellurium resistance membrane protein TerC
MGCGKVFVEMENVDLWSQLAALGQVIAIDLVLAGDNAIVVGMAAAGVPVEQRRKVIFWGVGAAIVLRIFFETESLHRRRRDAAEDAARR